MKIWHDDVREAPEGWTRVKNNDEAKEILVAARQGFEEVVEEISLDHDLGAEIPEDLPYDEILYLKGWSEDNGYELVKWMIEHDLVPPKITIHSWNVIGRMKMASALNDAGYSCEIRPFQI